MDMLKRKFMKAGACVLSAALIMGLYAGPAFAEWVESRTGIWNYVQDGKNKTGWQLIEGKWYFFNEEGIMQTGWLQYEGKWYFLGVNGPMCSGWLRGTGVNEWYYFGSDGDMVTGVAQINGKIYYFGTSDSGKMETGSVRIDGINYKFDLNGEAYGTAMPKPERFFETVKNADGSITVIEHREPDLSAKTSDNGKSSDSYDSDSESDSGYVTPTSADPSEVPTVDPSADPSIIPSSDPSTDTSWSPDPSAEC